MHKQKDSARIDKNPDFPCAHEQISIIQTSGRGLLPNNHLVVRLHPSQQLNAEGAQGQRHQKNYW
jgi:hypothetical protein